MPSNVTFREYTRSEIENITPEQERTYQWMLRAGYEVQAPCPACKDERHEDCDGLVHYVRGKDQPPGPLGYGQSWPVNPNCRCANHDHA